ncbi:MAG: hypothetical protein KatS3mg031_0300 [Chitinophagales bacterium]|nr:MAG: hypothetical protein KatS3mg031_0300 [Chitinophagales bacterium]
MRRFRMSCLQFSSLCFIFYSCQVQKSLTPELTTEPCIFRLTDSHETVIYNTKIDFRDQHYSGLLLLKTINNERRAVFTNEMGFKYFDFSFPSSGGFRVEYSIPPLKRRFLLHILRADIALLMIRGFYHNTFCSIQKGDTIILSEKGTRKYTTYFADSTCTRVQKGAFYSGKRLKASAIFGGDQYMPPDSVKILHHGIDLTIQFLKMKQQQN